LYSALIVRVQGRTLTQEQVKHELDATLQSIEQYLQWQRDSAAEFNRSIENASRIAIEARKQKLLSAQSLVAGLGFKLKERPDAPKTYSAPEVRRKIEPFMPKASTAPYKPEPVLDESHYTVILDTMENMAHVMERSPSAFNNMGEEDLRQHFLVQLNGRFGGAATGETFNYQGKTDILIRSGDRNIFIAECKFWHGEKAFKDTVDQLLSYLSWRDTKTAVVIFNRNKNFGAVLSSIKTAMSNHQHTKKGPTVQGESRFRYVLGNPSDHSREVIVTVMAFDIPT
jgi:hypothetical protein